MSISMRAVFYLSCPYVPYLILGTAIAKIQNNRMLGYGTGTGTGTVREGKGREGKVYGIPFLIPTYLTSDTLHVGRCC